MLGGNGKSVHCVYVGRYTLPAPDDYAAVQTRKDALVATVEGRQPGSWVMAIGRCTTLVRLTSHCNSSAHEDCLRDADHFPQGQVCRSGDFELVSIHQFRSFFQNSFRGSRSAEILMDPQQCFTARSLQQILAEGREIMEKKVVMTCFRKVLQRSCINELIA